MVSVFVNCETSYLKPLERNGTCWPEKHLAAKAGRTYDAPWDALKHVGCLCDAGYRGPACDFHECPSGSDPLNGYGNEAGRDCSGRGICNYIVTHSLKFLEVDRALRMQYLRAR